MEVCRHTTRPEHKNLDVRPGKLVAEGIGEGLLTRFVGVVYGLAGKGWHLESSDGGDVQDAAGFAGQERSVQDGVGDEHEAVDVGIIHRHDVVDF